MYKQTKTFCENCEICQKSKNTTKFRQPLHSIPCQEFGEIWSFDWVNMPKCQNGYKYALCLIEKLTKWPVIVPVKDITTETLAREMFNLCATYSTPKSFLSDRAPQHSAPIIRKLCELLKIKRLLTSSYKH